MMEEEQEAKEREGGRRTKEAEAAVPGIPREVHNPRAGQATSVGCIAEEDVDRQMRWRPSSLEGGTGWRREMTFRVAHEHPHIDSGLCVCVLGVL